VVKLKFLMFRYHKNGCKKLNAYDDALHARFIFNLHTKISFIFTQCTVDRYLVFTQCTTIVNQIPCRNNKFPDLLGGPMSCLWWRIPIHLLPCLLATAPPFDSYPLHPSPPPQPHYTIYSDVIDNHSLLHLGHLKRM
jgi:hypothetical protein